MSNIRLAFMSAIGIGNFAYRTGSYFPYMDYYLQNKKVLGQVSVGGRPLVIVPQAGTIINLTETQGSGKVSNPREFTQITELLNDQAEDTTFRLPGKLINLNDQASKKNGEFAYFYAFVLKYYGQGNSGRV